MTRRRLTLLVVVAVLVLGAAGGFYGFRQWVVPHLRVVRSGVLWRSGMPNRLGLEFARLAGIKTIVCLRDPTAPDVIAEGEFARAHGIEFVPMQLRFSGENIAEVAARFVEIVRDPQRQPVLVHCARGKERSGVCSAVFRMEFDGWSNEQALAEMYALGLERGTLPEFEAFIKSYRPARGGAATAPGQDGTPRTEQVPR